MFDPTPVAYAYGERTALGAFGLTKVAMAGKALVRGTKLLASNIPVAGAVINTGLGAAEGLMRGEGLKGAVVRGAISGGTGLISSPGVGMAASVAGDMAADKLLAPKPAPTGMTNFKRPAGPGPSHMPGAAGQGDLPGMVHY